MGILDPHEYVANGDIISDPLTSARRREFNAMVDNMGRNELRCLVKAMAITAGKQQRLISIDSLTQLMNRRGFESALASAQNEIERYKKTYVVAFIDLDGFKAVNDTFRHDAEGDKPCGDNALKEVAQRLLQTFRKTDKVARLGGDELALLLHFEKDEKFNEQTVRNKIRKALDGLVYWNENEMPYPIGASIGFASVNKYGQEAVRMADAAMYQDKMGKSDRQLTSRTNALVQRFGLENPEASLA